MSRSAGHYYKCYRGGSRCIYFRVTTNTDDKVLQVSSNVTWRTPQEREKESGEGGGQTLKMAVDLSPVINSF